MQIYVMDTPGHVIHIVEAFSSVIWNMQFYGTDDFELSVPGTKENVERLAIGTMLVRDSDMTDGAMHNVMLIEARELEFDAEKGWNLTVRGGGLKRLLARRVVWEQTNLSGNIEEAIRSVVTDNAIEPDNADRTVPGLVLGAPAGLTEEFESQLLGENLAEWISRTAETYGFGWEIYIAGSDMVFALRKGEDHTFDAEVPVIFSEEADNLLSSSYAENMGNYANAALVGGEGEGTSKRFATVGEGVGLARYESYIDGSGVSSNGEIITLETYLAMLAEYGKTELSKTATTKTLDGQIMTTGLFELGDDFRLGDIVQINTSNGISMAARITEIIYSEDANGWAVTPTFANWEVI